MRRMALARLRRSVAALMPLVVLAACSVAEAPSPADSSTRESTVAGRCPEPRNTARAPDGYYFRTNPLPKTAENLGRGHRLYESDAKPVPCAGCHGTDGNGTGPAGRELAPPPRNFRCAETMARITDGQMYWVIENGSGDFHLPSRQGAQEIERPGRRTRFTAMRAHKEYLSETDIWQLIMYIRTRADERNR